MSLRQAVPSSLVLLVLSLPGEEALEVVGGLQGSVDRYLTAIAKQCWERRAELLARIGTPQQVAERQAYIRARVLNALGGFPERTPLNARIVGTLEREGYRVEKLIYESLPRFYVTANVYVPARGSPPYPAVLGTAGHSLAGKAYPNYQRVWISLALRGVLVLAYDPPGQGERQEYLDGLTGGPRFGPTQQHTMAGIQCLLTGTNFARYELWDGVRAVDYLLTRRDVDPQRIGVVGNSGGGTQTAYLQVVEPRLALAAPSCYITSWERLWLDPGPQDAEQNLAGFLADGLDFSDFLIAFAPKPLKVLTAIRDYFPIEGARAAYREARRMYEILGAADRIDFFEYDDGHGWSRPRREATYRWVQQWLNRTADEGREEELAPEPEENLRCTETGQVLTALNGETVHSLNRALAERLYPERAAVKLPDVEALRRMVRAVLGVAEPRQAIPEARYGEIGRDGYRIEKIALGTEPGITVPALVFVPAAAKRPLRAILWINPAGKAADAARGGDLEALAQAGFLVMAPDLRGWGETAPLRGRMEYSGMWQTVMRALLVGKTLLGMQVHDLLSCFRYLASRPDVDPAGIGILGKANGGVVAIVAAALEPRVARVAAEGSVLSYMDIVRAPLHENMTELIVPGLLRHFDLPDLAAAVAPRPLWLVAPRTPWGTTVPLGRAEAEYRAAGRGLRVTARPLDWPLLRVYGEWLK
ncbi:MAG: acetylxylan esterase [Bryobacterales bacterium]|nr:acetylxylan esterase [Bryobacteraceae bacterium]MDW8131574.1 acetylxylan esterase [Bryobacterales bacterium]